MDMKFNPVGWFEIPVSDMDRAIKFYEAVFGYQFHRQPMGDLDMAWFPWAENGPGAAGSLVYHKEWYRPSSQGVVIYFSSPAGDLDTELSKVEAAGGKVLMPKKLITEEIGYMAVFSDTEGNTLALHSRK